MINNFKEWIEYNEGLGNFIRSKHFSDECIALGIYKRLNQVNNAVYESIEGGDQLMYQFTLDGFDIITRSTPSLSLYLRYYTLYIDSVQLNISDNIGGKIFKFFSKPKGFSLIRPRISIKEGNIKFLDKSQIDEDYTKKDAKIRFS